MNPNDEPEASRELVSIRSARFPVAPAPSSYGWALGLGCLGLVGLYLTSLHSYLLFHTLAELFTVVVAFSIFVIAWNSRRYIENGYLLFVGIAYLALGLLDLLHTLGYTGMPVFPGYPFVANQLWIAARFLESLSLLAAFAFLSTERRPDPRLVLTGFVLVTGLIIASIFFWHIFPACFVAGQGQTRFKIMSEYAIIAILAVDAGLLVHHRLRFQRSIYQALLAATVLAILTEAAFTVYVNNYGPSNMVGHYLKVFSYACIYVAIVKSGVERPNELIFRELTVVNERLNAEVAAHRTTAKERELAEGALRESEESYRRQFTDNTSVMLMIDPGDGQIRDVNTAAVTFYGYSREQLLAMRIADINTLPGDKVQAALDSAMANESERFVFQHRLADGSIRDVEVSASRIHLGERQALHSIVHDITERKQAEDQIRNSEALLASTQEAARAGSWTWDMATGRVAWTTGLFNLFGLPPTSEATFEAWRSVVHPDDLAGAETRIQEAITQGKALENEYRVVLPGGAIRWINAPGQTTYDKDGRPLRMMGLCLDITERKQMEGELQHTHDMMLQAQRIAHLGSFEYVAATQMTVWSEEEFRIYGLDPAKVSPAYDEMLAKCIHPDDAFLLDETFKKAMQSCSVYELEHRIVRPDGSVRWVHDLAHPYLNEQGEFVRYFGTTLDITERKRGDEERLKLLAQLQQSQKLESLGTLAGGVAHDMNNVLGAILGLASAHLGTQPYGSPLHQALDTICKATERGGKMVKSLLSFARQSPAESSKLDMNALVREQVALLERTTLAKIRLNLNLETELRPVLGDPSALTHAFMNLCVNAVDAMPENGTLTLHTRNVDNDWIEVLVEDTGMGMPKEVLERAMEPFFTTKGVGKGTGLGLSLVFSTVKAHRGQMAIESEPGKGTRVTLRLPACKQEAPTQAPATAVTDGTQASHGAVKVLLVDDDELIQSSVQAILEVLGYTAVTTAQSGEEALTMLEAGLEADLVILDMNMPGLAGIGTLPRLRAFRPEVPVLLATGRVDQAALTLASAHAGVTLLPKPFGLRELQKHLESIGLG